MKNAFAIHKLWVMRLPISYFNCIPPSSFFKQCHATIDVDSTIDTRDADHNSFIDELFPVSR